MGSDRRMFFNQLVNLGALSGLAAMLPSHTFAEVEKTLLGETTTTGIQIKTADGITRTYFFHAHAHSLRTVAGSEASVQLPEEGGFRSQFSENYQSGSGVSFKSAYMTSLEPAVPSRATDGCLWQHPL
jgi:hypothetical protein